MLKGIVNLSQFINSWRSEILQLLSTFSNTQVFFFYRQSSFTMQGLAQTLESCKDVDYETIVPKIIFVSLTEGDRIRSVCHTSDGRVVEFLKLPPRI